MCHLPSSQNQALVRVCHIKQQCLTPMQTSKSRCARQLACRWSADISSGQTRLQHYKMLCIVSMQEYMLLTVLCMTAMRPPLLQPPVLIFLVDVQLQAMSHRRNLKLLHMTSPMLPRLSALL